MRQALREIECQKATRVWVGSAREKTLRMTILDKITENSDDAKRSMNVRYLAGTGSSPNMHIRYTGAVKAWQEALLMVDLKVSAGEMRRWADMAESRAKATMARLSCHYGDAVEEFLSDRCRFTRDEYADFGMAEALLQVVELFIVHIRKKGFIA